MQMRDDQPVPSRKPRAIGSLFAVFAIAVAGVAWSGCGSDDETNTVRENAETQVEEGTKKAEDAVDEGVEKTEKGLEEAKKEVEKGTDGDTSKKFDKARKEAERGLEEGQAKAEKGLEEAKEQAEKYLP
jgi:type IV pilus biogenesis protein CpaD/CtpE